MRIPGALCLVALFAATACGQAQEEQRQRFREQAAETSTQPVQAELSAFNGTWVGSGRIARPAFRNRCGNGPLVQLDIADGRARAVFKLTSRRRMDERPRQTVLNLSGSLDDHGRLELKDFQSDVLGVLSARDGTGDGAWETRGLACHGTFSVRRKS